VFTERYDLIAYIKRIAFGLKNVVLRTDSGFAVYIINWLVLMAALESVYSAVRTDCLYKADCVWS
jgi:phage shock protein PspC (stress-responsive transcriptional regulator)